MKLKEVTVVLEVQQNKLINIILNLKYSNKVNEYYSKQRKF